jgi:hypothetical protein
MDLEGLGDNGGKRRGQQDMRSSLIGRRESAKQMTWRDKYEEEGMAWNVRPLRERNPS